MIKQRILEISISNYRKFITILWLFFKIGPLLLMKWFVAIGLKKKFEIMINLKFRSKKIQLLLESTFTDIKLLTEIFFLEIYKLNGTFNPTFIVDAGANKGLTAVYFSILWPKCEIHCFEPNNALIPILKSNLKLNRVNAKVFDYAISEKDGYEYFDIHNNHQYSRLSENKTGIKVKTINLESFYKDQRIDLLKLDVEGAEERIVSSLKNFNIDCIMGEIHHDLIDEKRFFRLMSENYDFKKPRWQHFITNPTVEYPILIAMRK